MKGSLLFFLSFLLIFSFSYDNASASSVSWSYNSTNDELNAGYHKHSTVGYAGRIINARPSYGESITHRNWIYNPEGSMRKFRAMVGWDPARFDWPRVYDVGSYVKVKDVYIKSYPDGTYRTIIDFYDVNASTWAAADVVHKWKGGSTKHYWNELKYGSALWNSGGGQQEPGSIVWFNRSAEPVLTNGTYIPY